MSENQNTPQKEIKVIICPVGAQLTDLKLNQKQRRDNYTKVGSIDFDEGTFQGWANRNDGSLLIVTPDQQHFLIDTELAINQIYKYWKGFQEIKESASDQPAT